MDKKQEVKHFVRIANTDLDGFKPIGHALNKIKGVSFMFSNLICKIAKVDLKKKSGLLTDEEVKKLEDVVTNPVKNGAPKWMLNRRFDPEDGEDKHLLTVNLKYIQDNDIKMMKKMKSYKGRRHASGLPVRGQRTKSNFRRSKGKVMGVKRKSQGKK
jgi:small subunit ribosomal protein S13|tara:strand:- start:3103 stop:3573 length:471 start_codon:yes stop_codon:yes gene_type:complete